MSPPVPPPASRTLQAVGTRPRTGTPLDTTTMIEALRGLTAQSAALAMLFDARSIAGERHLLSAWAHLGRARARGQTRLRDRGAELALFVAGDDQLPRALAKVGISKNTTELVVVAEKPRELSTMLQTFDLIEDPSVYPRPPAEATLERLGILGADRQAVPPSSWESLVLERVALLDLGAPHVPSPTKRKR